MDRIAYYRETIERVLTETIEYIGPTDGKGVEYKLLFDRERDSYALIAIGWEGEQRVLDIIILLEIINGKIRLQADNTDLAIGRDLERAGISKKEIVLGIHPPDVQPYTEYAAA
jgi:hypothetical protein